MLKLSGLKTVFSSLVILLSANSFSVELSSEEIIERWGQDGEILTFEAKSSPIEMVVENNFPILDLAKGIKNFTLYGNAFLEDCGTDYPTVIFTGYSESRRNYLEFIKDLCDKGIGPIFTMDFREQGHSTPKRHFEDGNTYNNPVVYDYMSYVDDMKKFVDQAVKPTLTEAQKGNLNLIAHSMGGAVGMVYLAKHANDFKKAFLISPMTMAKPFDNFFVRTAGRSIFVGCGNFKSIEFPVFEEIEKRLATCKKSMSNGTSMLTNDETRKEIHDNIRFDDGTAINGASKIWANQAVQLSNRALKDAQKNKTQTVIVTAGLDEIVSNFFSNKYANKANSNVINLSRDYPSAWNKCYANSHHGIHLEKNSIRNKLLRDIEGYFTNSPKDSVFKNTEGC